MGKMEASTMTENPVSYSHNSPESTSSEPDGSNIQEPLKKKLKTSESTISRKGEGEKLEERLNGILCCTVCLDLPVCTVYQCTNGHLMCAGCFTHLLADARLKDERATCPNCRCEISKNLCSRNLAVEKAVSELPIECPHCSEQLPRSAVDQHIWNQCQESTAARIVSSGCLPDLTTAIAFFPKYPVSSLDAMCPAQVGNGEREYGPRCPHSFST